MQHMYYMYDHQCFCTYELNIGNNDKSGETLRSGWSTSHFHRAQRSHPHFSSSCELPCFWHEIRLLCDTNCVSKWSDSWSSSHKNSTLRGASHYGRRSRGCRFCTNHIARNQEFGLSTLHTKDKVQKGCRNLKCLLFDKRRWTLEGSLGRTGMRNDMLNYTCLGFIALNWVECTYLHLIMLNSYIECVIITTMLMMALQYYWFPS